MSPAPCTAAGPAACRRQAWMTQRSSSFGGMAKRPPASGSSASCAASGALSGAPLCTHAAPLGAPDAAVGWQGCLRVARACCSQQLVSPCTSPPQKNRARTHPHTVLTLLRSLNFARAWCTQWRHNGLPAWALPVLLPLHVRSHPRLPRPPVLLHAQPQHGLHGAHQHVSTGWLLGRNSRSGCAAPLPAPCSASGLQT